MCFQGKYVLVTGGASGIGAAIAIRFAASGANVIVADVDGERAQQVIERITGTGGRAEFRHVDLSDEASIAGFGRQLREQLPSLQALVNNAGIVRRSAIVDTDHDDWDTQVAVNLRAPALLAKELTPLMQSSGGAIVNISSEGAFRPRAEHWVYDATKAGIGALTRTMAVEFAPYGIRANAVAPGWTVTEMHFGHAADPDARKAELESLVHQGCILRRLGTPEEIAAAVFFLASDDASYITGTTLHVDGGQGIH
jgi:NAD(P)-dependent dehydrogenase (short-subunit alcohol dehydrogenase family)